MIAKKQAVRETGVGSYLNERAVIMGGPDTVCRRVNNFMEMMGVNRYLFFLEGEDHDGRMKALDLFANKVLPGLHAPPVAASLP